MLPVIMRCAYCERPSTMRILSNPEHVCFEHAVEFWKGLLAYARHRTPPLLHEPLCACQSCQELGASARKDIAAEAAGSKGRRTSVSTRVSLTDSGMHSRTSRRGLALEVVDIERSDLAQAVELVQAVR